MLPLGSYVGRSNEELSMMSAVIEHAFITPIFYVAVLLPDIMMMRPV